MKRKPAKAAKKQLTAGDVKKALANIPDETPLFWHWDEGCTYHESYPPSEDEKKWNLGPLPKRMKLFQVREEIGTRFELRWRAKHGVCSKEQLTGKTVMALVV